MPAVEQISQGFAFLVTNAWANHFPSVLQSGFCFWIIDSNKEVRF